MADYHISFAPVIRANSELVSLQKEFSSFCTAFSSIGISCGTDAHTAAFLRRELSGICLQLQLQSRSLSGLTESLSLVVRTYQRTEHLIKTSTIPGISTAGMTAAIPGFLENPAASEGTGTSPSAADALFKGPDASVSAHAKGSSDEHSLAGSTAAGMEITALTVLLLDEHPDLKTKMEGKALHASAGVEGSFSSRFDPDDGRTKSSLSGKARAEASALQIHGSSALEIADWTFTSEGNAGFAGISATASTKLEFQENRTASVSGKLEAEAYLAKGEVSFGHKFGGIAVTLTGEAMAGLQAELKGELSTSHVKGKIGLGPFGAGVRIDWKDLR